MFELIKSAKSQNSYPIELYSNCVKSGRKILVIGGFHGDEYQAPEILAEYLNEKVSAKNEVYILPCLNPDGFSAVDRVNANGVDLNRNFPTQNWEKTEQNEFFGGDAPASEVETRFMCDVLERFKLDDKYNLDLIVSIHAPFKIVNFDGPAEEYAKKVSQIMEYPVQGDIGYPTPGSFGTYCGVERNIPTITLELGEDEDMIVLKERCYKLLDWLSNC